MTLSEELVGHGAEPPHAALLLLQVLLQILHTQTLTVKIQPQKRLSPPPHHRTAQNNDHKLRRTEFRFIQIRMKMLREAQEQTFLQVSDPQRS